MQCCYCNSSSIFNLKNVLIEKYYFDNTKPIKCGSITIGSAGCNNCIYNYSRDLEEHWIKCTKLKEALGEEKYKEYLKNKPLEFPRVMEVSDDPDFDTSYRRVVITQNRNIFVAWNYVEPIEDIDQAYGTTCWKYAREIPQELPKVELTIEEIATKLGYKPEQILIKDKKDE